MQITTTDNFMRSLGIEAYRVGGSVRDELLGRKPKDADYVVRGVTLSELEKLLRANAYGVSALVLRNKTQVGWRATVGKEQVEIALPRRDTSTGPGHGDFAFDIDPHLPLAEDAVRRDFTFNALYTQVAGNDDWLGEIIDPLGGLDDLKHRRINVTHATSFADDPLRMLRALRFVSTLGYELGPETYALMCADAEKAHGLTSPPRTLEKMDGGSVTYPGGTSGTVLDELKKLLMGDNVAEALRVARDTGVLAVVLPELAPMLGFEQGSRYHDMTTDEHVFTALEVAAAVAAPLEVRMALLFHDAGKPASAWEDAKGFKHYYEARWHSDQDGDRGADHQDVGLRIWNGVAKRLNMEKALSKPVATIIANHMVACEKVDLVKMRRARVKFGDELLGLLYLHRMCDLSGKGNRNGAMLGHVAELEIARRAAAAAGTPSDVRDLKITGKDVAQITKGSKVGKVLAAVLDEVVVAPDELRTTRDWQLAAAERLARKV